ncbi:MAG: HDIG domain-containing metalloprotein [Pseudomonadota bacterium]
MLSRSNAGKILSKYGGKARWVNHCIAVADLADHLAPIIGKHHDIDADFLWSAALLHDIGRHVTHDPVRHGVAGYNLMMELGHPDEAYVCASHVLFGLKADEAAQFGLPRKIFVPRKMEERLVALIDYLIEFDKPTTLQARFSSLRARNADNGFFFSRLGRAEKAANDFMAAIASAMGQTFEDALAAYSEI